jgi:hypothetical protein
MANSTRSGGLQTIFSIFLGLMVAAFVGVGVYTFYPPPQQAFGRQIEELNRGEQAIRNRRAPEDLTAADREQIQSLADERNSLIDASNLGRQAWGRTTSIVLIVFATLAMAVSLVRADQLPVISNGLLLGGVFTMVYGVGWIVATDTSVARFFVMTAALAITLGLGYVRFVRRQAAGPATRVSEAGQLGDLEGRLRDLEDRLDRAAGALGRESRKD